MDGEWVTLVEDCPCCRRECDVYLCYPNAECGVCSFDSFTADVSFDSMSQSGVRFTRVSGYSFECLDGECSDSVGVYHGTVKVPGNTTSISIEASPVPSGCDHLYAYAYRCGDGESYLNLFEGWIDTGQQDAYHLSVEVVFCEPCDGAFFDKDENLMLCFHDCDDGTEKCIELSWTDTTDLSFCCNPHDFRVSNLPHGVTASVSVGESKIEVRLSTTVTFEISYEIVCPCIADYMAWVQFPCSYGFWATIEGNYISGSYTIDASEICECEYDFDCESNPATAWGQVHIAKNYYDISVAWFDIRFRRQSGGDGVRYVASGTEELDDPSYWTLTVCKNNAESELCFPGDSCSCELNIYFSDESLSRSVQVSTGDECVSYELGCTSAVEIGSPLCGVGECCERYDVDCSDITVDPERHEVIVGVTFTCNGSGKKKLQILDKNGNVVFEEENYPGQPLTPPEDPTPPQGCKFLGYSYSDDCTDESCISGFPETMPDDDITLYEVFTDPIVVTLTFVVDESPSHDDHEGGCWTKECADCDYSDKTLTGFYGDPVEIPSEWGRPRLVTGEGAHPATGWKDAQGNGLPGTFPDTDESYTPVWDLVNPFVC